MKKLAVITIAGWITTANLQLVAAQYVFSWVREAYTAGPTTASYQVYSQFLGCHKVQRWKLQDGTYVEDTEANVASQEATNNGGYYWEGICDRKCRLMNCNKSAQLLRTRFESPQQVNHGTQYTAPVRPSASNKRQKYTLPGTPKDGQDSTMADQRSAMQG